MEIDIQPKTVGKTNVWRCFCFARGYVAMAVCEAERILVPGADLRLVDPCDGGVSLLTESELPEVARDYLRHTCDGRVVPVAPIE